MHKTSSTRLELAGELSLRGIAELKSRLSAALASRTPLTVDTARVESIDVGVMQLLLAAQKSANTAGTSMVLSAAPGGPVGRALIALGLVAADGRPLVPETATWTLASEAR